LETDLPTKSISAAWTRSGLGDLEDAMVEGASLLVQRLEREKSHAKPVARLAVAISLGTLAWAFVIAFAIFGFSHQKTWRVLKQVHGLRFCGVWHAIAFRSAQFSVFVGLSSNS
jgi:hypothetical protein